MDAANVIGSRPDGWWRDRPGAARRLVEALCAAVRAGRVEGRVLVVLEGAARAGVAEGRDVEVEVVHAPGGGDDTLVELAASLAPAPVVLVSADRALRRRVLALGVPAEGPRWLHALLR